MPRQDFSTKKSQETYERVLAAACGLFAEKGYDRTTMRDVSAASGLGLGALYYYFRSKEDIVQAFYERINEQVVQEVRAQAAPVSMAQGFGTLMESKLRALQAHHGLMRIIIREAVDPQSPLCPLSPESEKPLGLSMELFESLARLDKAAKSAEDVQNLARGLWALHMALLGYWIHDRTVDFAATKQAVETATQALTWSSRLARIPGFSPLRAQMLGLVARLMEKPETAAG